MNFAGEPIQPLSGAGLLDGNASMGSQGSGIETLDIPNSRQRRMIRPPTGGGNSASRQSLGGENSANKPPAASKGGLNQIQELHQNNRLTRPTTGGKPPAASGKNTLEPPEDAGYLDLLEESQNAHSNAGSHLSAGLKGASAATGVKRDPMGITAGSGADFERAEDELQESYEQTGSDREGGGSSDDSDDVGSFYQPTLMAKVESKPKKKKKQKAATKSTKPPNMGTSSLVATGGNTGKLDFENPKNATTLNSDTVPGGQSSLTPPRPPARSPSPSGKKRPTDPKGMLEYDIEMEREKIQKMENRYREEAEKVRKLHLQAIEQQEKAHKEQKDKLDEEKKVIVEEKSQAIEQEKKQLT